MVVRRAGDHQLALRVPDLPGGGHRADSSSLSTLLRLDEPLWTRLSCGLSSPVARGGRHIGQGQLSALSTAIEASLQLDCVLKKKKKKKKWSDSSENKLSSLKNITDHFLHSYF